MGNSSQSFQVFVVLQQLDGKETRGIFVADVLIDADDALHLLNATFQLGTVIDMDMTVEATRLFYLFLWLPKSWSGTYS